MDRDFEELMKKVEGKLTSEQIQGVKHRVLEDTFKVQRGLYALRLLEERDEDVNYTEEVLQRIQELEPLIELKIIGAQ